MIQTNVSHSTVFSQPNVLNSRCNLVGCPPKHRLPGPSEISCLDFKGKFRRSEISSVSVNYRHQLADSRHTVHPTTIRAATENTVRCRSHASEGPHRSSIRGADYPRSRPRFLALQRRSLNGSPTWRASPLIVFAQRRGRYEFSACLAGQQPRTGSPMPGNRLSRVVAR